MHKPVSNTHSSFQSKWVVMLRGKITSTTSRTFRFLSRCLIQKKTTFNRLFPQRKQMVQTVQISTSNFRRIRRLKALRHPCKRQKDFQQWYQLIRDKAFKTIFLTCFIKICFVPEKPCSPSCTYCTNQNFLKCGS